MPTTRTLQRLFCTAIAASVLASCGGSSGDGLGPSTPVPAPAPAVSTVPPAPPPAGSAAECFNPAQYVASAGFAQPVITTTWERSNGTSFTSTVEIVRTQHVHGAVVQESIVDTDRDIYSSSPITPGPRVVTLRRQTTEGLDLILFSHESHRYDALLSAPRFEVSITFDPPLRDRRFSLERGQTYSTGTWLISSGSDAESRLSVFAPQLNTYTSRHVLMGFEVTYLGQEEVTVPAGTFTACRFQEVITGVLTSPFRSSESWLKGTGGTRWIAKGTGQVVKWDPTSAQRTQTLVKVAVR